MAGRASSEGRNTPQEVKTGPLGCTRNHWAGHRVCPTSSRISRPSCTLLILIMNTASFFLLPVALLFTAVGNAQTAPTPSATELTREMGARLQLNEGQYVRLLTLNRTRQTRQREIEQSTKADPSAAPASSASCKPSTSRSAAASCRPRSSASFSKTKARLLTRAATASGPVGYPPKKRSGRYSCRTSSLGFSRLWQGVGLHLGNGA